MNKERSSDNGDFEKQYRLAQQLCERGDLEGAIKATGLLIQMAEEAGEINERVTALLLHGTYLVKARRDDQLAAATLEECSALSRRADTWGAYTQSELLLGIIEMKYLRWVSALERYANTIELLRENADTMYIEEKVQALNLLCDYAEDALRMLRLDDSVYQIWIRTVRELLRTYPALSRNDDGLKLAEDALNKPLKENDRPSIYEQAGMTAMMLGQPQRALGYFEKGLDISEKLSGPQLGTLSLLQNIARAYRCTGAFTTAVASLERAEAIMRHTEIKDETVRYIHINNLIEIASIHREMAKPGSARPYLQRALEKIELLPPNATMTLVQKASALTNLGLLNSDEGKYGDAVTVQKEALRMYESGNFANVLGLAQVETNLAVALSYTDDLEQAIAHWQESLRLNQQICDMSRVLRALLSIAELERRRRNHAGCLASLEKASNMMRASGDLDSCSRILFNMAQEHRAIKEYRVALGEFEESSSLSSSVGKLDLCAMALSECADVCKEINDIDKAIAFRKRAADAWRAAGDHDSVDQEELALIEICLSSGRKEVLERPMDVLDRLSKGRSLGVPALFAKARLLQLEGRVSDALSTLNMFLERMSESNDDAEKALFFTNRGVLLAEQNCLEEALDSFKAGLALIDSVSDVQLQGDLWKCAGDFFSRIKKPGEAYMYFNHALESFRRAGAENKVAEINELLDPINVQAIIPSLLYTKELWEYGLSRRTGWTQDKGKVADLLPRNTVAKAELTESDPDLQALEEVISVYHEIGVWEDPNLGIFVPIIDFYTRRTKFSRRTLINPLSLVDGCLHFFFFRSDPLGKLAHVLDTCLFVGSGNVVFCSLPFLEKLASYLAFGKTGRLSLDDFFRIDTSEAKIVAELTRRHHIESNRTLIEWVLAHEIGHAALGHPSRFLHPTPPSPEFEQEADDFFIDCYRIADLTTAPEVQLHVSLSTIILNVYHNYYEREYGHVYAKSEWVTLDAPIHITKGDSAHAPLIIRLLDLVDRHMNHYPDVDRSDYFARVRQNITVVERD